MHKKKIIFFSILLSLNVFGELPEMVIGQESVKPGINFVFEGAIKDDVTPSRNFGSEKNSDIHLEVLANWNEDAPRGSPIDGFVAYLRIKAEIQNQYNSQVMVLDLLPHINLSDSLHYALNTKLPGKKDDLYSIKFTILPPETSKLGLHYDWREEVGPVILETFTFEYKNLDFSEIAISKRR
ncbi:iron transporter [Gammaproteobacteria bacterium]|nr:iron transporter [Gammaproteobacteria bacterium]